MLTLLFLKELGASEINEKLFGFLVNLQCANTQQYLLIQALIIRFTLSLSIMAHMIVN